MALKENEKKALFKLKQELQKKYNILDFKLYGSKAKGTDVPGSDIDLMIELERVNPKIREDIFETVFEINLQYDSFISTVLFTKEELEEGPMDQSPLYKAIQKEGIAL